MDADQKYIAYLEQWAKEQGKRFIIEDFDARETLFEGMAVAEVWGWLIAEDEKPDDSNFGLLQWSLDGGALKLTFEIVPELEFP